MFAWQFSKALYLAGANGWTSFVSMQNHLNLVYREEEREMLPLCREKGIGVIPWSPLARGFLTRPQERSKNKPTARARSDTYAHDLYYEPEDYEVVDRVVAFAQRKGVTPAQIALAWLLHKPGVTSPIIGATRMHHLEEAVAAVAIELTDEEIAQLEEPYRPHPVLGHN